MLLNGKAELDAQAAKMRYERIELFGIAVVLSTALLLCIQLNNSMVDGWQNNENARWHVLCLSVTLLVLSVVACVYLCHRLQPTVRLHSAHPVSVSNFISPAVPMIFKILFDCTGSIISWRYRLYLIQSVAVYI